MLSSFKIAPILTAASLALAGCKKENTVSESSSGIVSGNLPQVSEVSQVKQDLVLTYAIKKGDTLSQIAKRFKVELDDLKEANNIDNPNLIKIGQILTIYVQPQDRDSGAKVGSENNKVSQDAIGTERAKQDQTTQDKTDRTSSLSKGEVPTLSKSSMPAEAKEHSRQIGNLVRRYALDQNLGIVGPPLCGQGVCNAFNVNKSQIPGLGALDAVFADKQFFQEHFGSVSRDAWKIREVLDILSARDDTGWVKVDIHDFAKSYGPVVRKDSEGSMYRTHNFPDGAVVCYDPNPKKLGQGSGAEAHGHIEWITKDAKGVTWHVHAINSEVHGGSVFGRQQLHKAIKYGQDTCHLYMLTTPEIKAKWLARDQATKK